MKYSLDQDQLKNEMKDAKYNNYIKNEREKNSSDRAQLLNMIKEVPSMIQNKINQIYQEEIEENRNQSEFFNQLKNQIVSEIKNQRREDDIKHRKQINELKKLKEDEEKEKIKLINEIQRQRHNLQMQKYNRPFRSFKYKRPKRMIK